MYLPGINNLINSEYDKYSLRKSLRLEDSQYHTYTEHNKKLNEKIKVKDIIINEAYHLKKEQIQNHISTYNLKNKNGIGVTYIIESLNKTEIKAFVYIVLFDMKTNNILSITKTYGLAGGFGWKNYWAAALRKVNWKIKTEYYKRWKKDCEL